MKALKTYIDEHKYQLLLASPIIVTVVVYISAGAFLFYQLN